MWRPATPADHSDIVAMCVLLNQEDPGMHPVPPAHMERTLAFLRDHPTRGTPMVLAIDGVNAGYAVLIPFWSNEYGGEVCIVDEVYVKAAYRKRGHMTALMEELIGRRHPATRDAVAVGLEVTPSNTNARRSYERLGFRGKNTIMHRKLA